MQVSQIIDIAIIAIPTCYALYIAVQFATGLAKLGKRPIVSSEPQEATTESADEVAPKEVEVAQVPDTIESEGYCPAVTYPIAASIAPVVTADWCKYTSDDYGLVDVATTAIAQYWNRQNTHNVVEFKRPPVRTQKPLQQHPAIKNMTLAQMRKLGTRLKIKGAARWNRIQAQQALAGYYRA